MHLNNYFDNYKEDIARWRANYSVEKAEKYILMINLAGLAASVNNSSLNTPRIAYDNIYSEINQEDKLSLDSIERKLIAKDIRTDIFGVKDFWFCRNGLALINGKVIDVWEQYLNGVKPVDIIKQAL